MVLYILGGMGDFYGNELGKEGWVGTFVGSLVIGI